MSESDGRSSYLPIICATNRRFVRESKLIFSSVSSMLLRETPELTVFCFPFRPQSPGRSDPASVVQPQTFGAPSRTLEPPLRPQHDTGGILPRPVGLGRLPIS